jgi:hypothetical protein
MTMISEFLNFLNENKVIFLKFQPRSLIDSQIFISAEFLVEGY